ncbi:MAG: hypothetical protein MUC63_08715, partial [Planctomycetes bacterium]|nr:hypothetical protein [Planctomycetota bacterium]
SLAVSRWGLAFARAKELKDAENVLLYNLSTFTLPWWSDSLEATAGEREEGLGAADRVLALRRKLGKGPADLSKAHWALGAHRLLRGDAAPAIEAFNAAVVAAREAGDKGLEACALDGLARTRLFLVPAERAWGLETLREAKALYEEAKDSLNLGEVRRLEARLAPAKVD